MTASTRSACGEHTGLPSRLIPVALRFAATRTADVDDVERHLRCTLEEHAIGDHHAFVMHLDGPDTGSVWARWIRGHRPAALVVLSDCPAASSPATGQEPCSEFATHPGGHTWQLADPWAAASAEGR